MTRPADRADAPHPFDPIGDLLGRIRAEFVGRRPGRGGRLHPRAVDGGPRRLRPGAGRRGRIALRGRRVRRAVHHPVGLQAVRLRAGSGRCRRRGGAGPGGGGAERRGVQRHQPRARHGAPRQPADQRRRHPHHLAGGGRRPRGAVRADPRPAVAVRRPGARGGRVRVPVRARHRRPEPGARPPDARRRLAHRAGRGGRGRLLPPVLGAGHRRRPGRDGRHAGQRRRQPPSPATGSWTSRWPSRC